MSVDKRIVALSVCVLMSVRLVCAQAADEGAVKGLVVEADANWKLKYDSPVFGALVTALSDGDLKKKISDLSSDLHQRPTRPPKGAFTIPGLRLDNWCFVAYKEGYNSYPLAKRKLTTVIGRDTVNAGWVPIQPARKGTPLGAPTHARRGASGAQVVLVIYKRPPGPLLEESEYQVNIHVDDPIDRSLHSALVLVLEYPHPGGHKLVELARGFTDENGDFQSRVLPKEGRGDQYVLAISKYGYRSLVLVNGWRPTNIENSDQSALTAVKKCTDQTKARFGGLTPVCVALEKPLDVSESGGDVSTDASHRKVFTGESGRTIEALPLAGMRSFDSLALLSPGIAPPPETLDTVGPSFASGIGTAGSFATNGLRARENSFTVDDGDDNDELVGIRRQGFVVPSSLAVETLQEFQVISALPDARFGRAIGGQVNVVTKPSVGGLHGIAYGFFTDRRLLARNFSEGLTEHLSAQYPVTTQSGVPVLLDGQQLEVPNPSPSLAPFSRLQSGAAIGLNRHQTYVFLAGERQILKGRSEDHFVVPTIEERGMFASGATGLSVNGTASFPDTLVGDAIFSLYPFPNNPQGPFGPNTYTSQLPAEGNGIRTSLKVDHQYEKYGFWVGFRGNYTREKSVRGSTNAALDSEIAPNIQNYGFSMVIGGHGPTQAHTLRFSGNGTVASLNSSSGQILTPDANLLLNITQPGSGSQPPPQVLYVSAASPSGQQIMQSLGMANITTSLPITGKFGQVAVSGFSSIGGDPLRYPQHRNNSTAQISYSGTITRPDRSYSFGAEWLGRRVETRLISNALPFLRFSGLHNTLPGNPPIVNTPSRVASMDNLSAATLAAMGVPSVTSQTFLDLRPQSPAAPQGLVPVPTLLDSQGTFFVHHERQVKPGLRVTAGVRIDVANVTDPVSDKNRTRSALYNHEQLLTDAQEAENNCAVRCSGLSSAIAQAFKGNSFSVTAGNRFRLGPRLGFAWAPLPERAWSIRGGIGMHSGELQFFAANDARQGFNTFMPMNLANFPITTNQGSYLFNLANSAVRSLSPGFNVFPEGLGSLNGLIVNPFLFMTQGLYDVSALGLQPTIPSIALIEPSPRLKNPYSLQYSIGTEVESHGFSLSLSYVGTRGVKLLRLSTPIGGSNRASLGLQGISVLAQGIPTVQGQLSSPGAQALLGGSLTLAPTEYESAATSLYNSLQLEIRRHYRYGVQFSSAITYSRASDDSSDVTDLVGSFPLAQNSQNRSEWSRSNFDEPLRFVLSFVWDIAPKHRNPLFRGWQISGITSVENGQPFTVNSTFDINEDGNLTDRLNSASGIIRTSGRDSTIVLQLAPGVSTWSLLAPTGQNGSVQRDSFRAPARASLDLALTKVIELGEGRQITIRCEGFNALNTPQFGIPQRLLEAPSFGREVRTTAPARLLQFGLKFSF